ncbi:MAG: tryptophan 7-halogenase, partial [Myxococcales bacterium]|nr:tryptophan 7-halogenase [Myxococcales bacterium]
MTTVERFDVAVVGGGPAGTAAAALVAQAGWSVVVLERERFPRFHIGESLLPSCLPVLARVGLDLEKLGYLRKLGAEFHDEAIGETSYFPFADALPGPPRFAYQVERDRFDTDLADAARRSGATVREGVTVFEHAVGDDAVELRFAATPPGSGPDEGRSGSAELRPGPDRAAASVVRARYLVDASGRRGLLSRGGRDVLVIPGLGRAASFVHYDGLDDDAWAELAQRGDVKVLRIEDGWLWAIPLAGRRLSIGAVLRTSPIAEDRV